MSNITSSELGRLITALRNESARDSISPENVGYILQQIINYIDGLDASGMSKDIQSALTTARNAARNAAQAITTADQAMTAATNAGTVAGTANTNAADAKRDATTAKETANAAASDASDALTAAQNAVTEALRVATDLKNLVARIGDVNGIAPLDDHGKISSEYLPDGFGTAIVPFDGFASGLSVAQQNNGLSSTEDGCRVVFNLDTNRFVFGVGHATVTPLSENGTQKIVGAESYNYYNNWRDRNLFGSPTLDGCEPYSYKIYYDVTSKRQYRYNDGTLEMVSAATILGEDEDTAYAGDKGAANAEAIANLRPRVATLEGYATGTLFLNLNAILNTNSKFYTLANAIAAVPTRWRVPGIVIHFLAEDDWETWTWNTHTLGWPNPKAWKKTGGGGSSTGNIINVNEIAPKEDGYYNRATASLAVPEELRTGGRKITFMSAANVWQTWQFVGSLLADWADETKWVPEVKGISFNGAQPATPDRDGNILLEYHVDVDEQLNKESSNPIANKTVVSEFERVQQTIPTGLRVEGQQLSLLDSDGNPASVVTLPSGGGGGNTNPTAVEITIASNMLDTLKEGDPYSVEFVWRHYNINTNVDTQYGGRAEVIVNGSSVLQQDVTQGLVRFDIGACLAVGSNTVRIKITADDGVIAQSALIRPTVVTLALSSPYALATLTEQGSPVAFRYVVTGSGTKTVHFILDGNPLSPESITTSGATNVKSIATDRLQHGAHSLEVYAEREISDSVTLASNHLNFDLMVVANGNDRVIIATEFGDNQSVEQYSTIVIPYAVYDPTSTYADVEIKVNGTTYQMARVDRSRQTVSFRTKSHGTIEFAFKVGSVTRTVNVNVTPAEVQIDAETDALALHLSSSGRTNAATNAGVWSFTDENHHTTTAIFTDCGFDTESGWKADANGLVSLHLAKGARCLIPYKPFESECKNTGKTIEIEFKVSNCYDDEATLISCLAGKVGFEVKAHEAYFSSALMRQVSTKFKQDERMRIGFVVEDVSGNRFIHLYLDGKHAGVVQYDTSDYFVQNIPVGITMGHPSCELDIYNIRVYDNALSMRQMCNNYIADCDDTDLMFRKLEANDIINADSAEGAIDYDKAVQKIPCITFIGDLPSYKGDKKKNTKIVYENRQHPEFSFTCAKAQNDVQGTSSQYYPRKNWKFKFLVDIIYSQSGHSSAKYALRAVDSNGNAVAQKAVKCFCLKADFAESSGTHNTGAANFINEVLVNSGILTPPQMVDRTVRTTVYGHPILMFHQTSESAPRVFIGKYNFNNDKSTQDTYGFEKTNGYNKGMVNRDDYLVYNGGFADLQADGDAYANADDGELMYMLDNNHLAKWNESTSSWADCGELWQWDPYAKAWKNLAGSSFTDGLAKVGEGYLVENNCECWEFTNNGHPMCLFHSSDFTSVVRGDDIPDWFDDDMLPSDAQGKYAPYWAGAFEPRYPDNDDNNKQYAHGRIPRQLKRVLDWLASLNIMAEGLTEQQKAAMDARFVAEYQQYFHKDALLSYDLIREGLLMADQGAKNMMWVFFDGLCYPIFYDNDTILGLNNEGRNQFGPYVEPHSVDRLGKFVFNGESSTLWNLIERNLDSEKAVLYSRMVSQGGFTYDRALYWFNNTQSEMWSESIYNADSKFKYIDSFGVASEDGSGTQQNYLDIAQGSREAHRKWMLFERFSYLNSKRCTGSYRESYVYLRANTHGDSSVPSDVAVTVTAAQDWYFGFRFSGNAGYSSRFLRKGESFRFTAPAGSRPNDTECYVHQADRISHLGDLSTLYPTSLQVTACKMLEELIVGNETAGYIGKLAFLTLGVHPLLKKLNVVNCPTLTSSIGAQGCTALEEVYAQGSCITAINLPVGSVVRTMHLPGTIVQLLFDRFQRITYSGLTLDGYSRIQTVSITSCPNLDSVRILEDIMNTQGNSLQYVKLTDIDLQGTGYVLLKLIRDGVRGADNRNGKPEIYGRYTLTKLLPSEDVATITNGIEGLTVVIGLEAYIDRIDEVNAATYSGAPEVGEVNFDNIGDHLLYYNGETYEEYVARIAEANRSIHDIIND